jgi:hypothetical protein
MQITDPLSPAVPTSRPEPFPMAFRGLGPEISVVRTDRRRHLAAALQRGSGNTWNRNRGRQV